MTRDQRVAAIRASQIPLVPLYRLAARRSVDASTGEHMAEFDAEPVECGHWTSIDQVMEAAACHGDGIYEWAWCRGGYSPNYVQVRNGRPDWRRMDVALRKVVERDCGRRLRPVVGPLWLRTRDVRRRALRDVVVEPLLPPDAAYSVRVSVEAVGRPFLDCGPATFFGLQLDDDVCEDVGQRLGTVVIDHMIAIRCEPAGPFHRVDCIALDRDAPRHVVRYVMVDKPTGPSSERIVAIGSEPAELLQALAEMDRAQGSGTDTGDCAPDDPDVEFLRSVVL